MIDSSGIGVSGGATEWWDVPVTSLSASSDEWYPGDEFPPDMPHSSAAEEHADALTVLRTPGLDPSVDSIAVLAGLNVDRLSLTDRIDAVAVWGRATAWLEGLGQQLLASVAAADTTRDQWAREEIAAVLGLAPVTASGYLARAAALTDRLPGTLDALLAGHISGLQARAVVDASGQLPDGLAGDLESAVLPRASSQTLAELKRSLRRAVLRLDPAAAEQRRKAAHADRYVRIGNLEDGMAQLWALLPAADAQAIHDQVDATARRIQRADPTELRTRDQLRADALTAAVLSAGLTHGRDQSYIQQTGNDSVGSGAPSAEAQSAPTERQAPAERQVPTEQNRRPAVNVIVGLSTLLGQDNEPAELEGYGPITAGYAREICHDPTGTWRRLIVDPVGQLVEVGRCTYRPPAAIRNLVLVRNSVCSFPGCNHRAVACDLDHCVPWPRGATSARNLHPLCRRHHRAKHEAGWRVQLDPDGTTHWRSPSGRDYTSRPPTRWNRDPDGHDPDGPDPDGPDPDGHDPDGHDPNGPDPDRPDPDRPDPDGAIR
ncbi:MAG: endonuclease [Frankiales bacterium]|nr:endonuclease [Frankiales bacterium]